MKKFFASALTLGLLCSSAMGQAVTSAPTTNASASITTGGTFQLLLAAKARHSLTVQNNNTNGDNCRIYVGSGVPSTANSVLLSSTMPYTRYYPFLPNDALWGTCDQTNDTIYVDTQ